MNKNIDILSKLAQQAGLHPEWFIDNPEIEKFAELIVLECERVAKDPKWYGESPSNGWGNPIRHVCNVMKEHFGVKE